MWAGDINLRSGHFLTAVQYDTEATAAAIRRWCSPWLDDSDRPRRAAFGVREVKVGLRRRRLGLLHHGAPIRHRAADVDAAARVLATMLEGVSARPAAGEVHVDARTFVRSGRAALLALPARVDFDDRRTTKAGIVERPSWRAVVDPASGRVRDGEAWLPLVGLVVADVTVGSSPDNVRRHLWTLGEGNVAVWSTFLDGLGPDAMLGVAEAEAGPAIVAILDA